MSTPTDRPASGSSGEVAPGSIAVVGMAGRFPAARSVGELWQLLDAEREATRWLTDDELLAAGVSAAALSDPNYVRASLILPDMEMFDADFFGFSPREAAILDPQHRHFLECAWEALEDAGHMPDRFAGSVGVFAGCGMQAYFAYNLLSNPELVDSVGLFLLRHTGNDKDFLPTRLSYLLNLNGPSLAIQTACSTSLVAIHVACQSLLTGGCDMALAGGVSIEVPHRRGYRFAEGEILSPDGHCRAFDDEAKGTLFGSGVGVVVLRRLEDAIKDGDNIHLVIRGSAVNNDGAQKAGYLAPSVDGHARAAAEALAVADIDPSTVSYIEAHGTGTAVGDPIELAALAEAYGRDRNAPCGVGSIKTNIGHLDTAAGVASLIKVALAMRHGKLPASLNFRRPNSRFDFANSRFYVVDRGRPWTQAGAPRRAAVNSLGVGGTNAHVLVEEPPPRMPEPVEQDWQVLTLSARSEGALQRLGERWLQFTAEPPRDFAIPDAAFTTQVGRRTFDHRRAIIARDVDGLRAALGGQDARRAPAGVRAAEHRVVFMFPGGGAQYPGAARELYDRVPAFRAAVEECFRVMPAAVPGDLRTLMFERASDDRQAALVLEQPVRALAALFVLEYAFAELWRDWGVTPDAVIGHSAGEYAAAAIAGVMSVKDALSIVVSRGQIFERMAPGSMLSVQMPEAELRALLGDELDMAAVNAADLCVASGPIPALERVEGQLRAREIEARRVRINVAAHSRLLDPHLPEFHACVEKIRLSAPHVPFVSTLTGNTASTDQLTTADYWVRQLRQTVRFGDGLSAVLDQPGAVLLEVGPGQTLASLARAARGRHRTIAIVPSSRRADDPEPDLATALAAAGRLWTVGRDLDWERVRGRGVFRRISLPTYAFERQGHWIEPGVSRTAPAASPTTARAAISRLEIDDWFNVPEWRPAPLAPGAVDRGRSCLVFAGAAPLGSALEAALRQRGGKVRVVRPGDAFGRSADGGWIIDPSRPDQYVRLLSEFESGGALPSGIFYLWALDAPRPSLDDPQAVQAQIFEPLFYLCQALQQQDSGTPIHLVVATTGTLALPDEQVTHPERATLFGPCRAAAREIPLITAQLVDVVDGRPAAAAAARALLAEVDGGARDELVIHRGDGRWVQDLTRVRLDRSDRLPERLRSGGVYVITGGLGGIGLELAQFLASNVQARLALIGRRELPPRETWPALAASVRGDGDTECIRRLVKMEGAGAEVLVLSADVGDAGQMRRALDQVRRRFGRIDGVFHAAGVLDDAPLAVKTMESARRVMTPKVAGGLVLHELLPAGSVDLFAVFSSASVTLGNPGQVDYIAANAFLDTLAAARPDGLAIAWGIWGDTGMAARRYRKPSPSVSGQVVLHPLLGAETSRSEKELCFEAILDRHSTWVLDEHVVADRAVLPGMAYVEIARAAMAVIRPDPIEITNLSFVAPLAFDNGEARLVRTSLSRTTDGFEFAVHSRSAREARAETNGWTVHAQGQVRFIEAAATRITSWAFPPVGGLGPASERPAPAQADAMSFGPRWHNLASQRFGRDGGVAEVELPERFAADLDAFPVHPAMTDMAATFGITLLKQRTSAGMLFFPMSIERVRISGGFPRRLRSTCRLTKEIANSFATFDVLCTDSAGNALVSFEGLSLRCAGPGTVFGAPAAGKSGDAPLVEQMLAAGIRAMDAPDLFARLLGSSHRRVVVSSMPLAALRQLLSQATDRPVATKQRSVRAPSSGYANEIEAQIAGYWNELLGVDAVKPEDEFFALGGHSLAAVRLFAKIRKQLGVDLPLASLFEARTLRQLADLVASKSGRAVVTARPAVPAAESAPSAASTDETKDASDWAPLVTINRGDPTRRPFFCVHGGGGNVLVFGELSQSLGRDQPFYGLQAQGIDGRRRPLTTVEAMAESYLAAIRAVQPTGPYLLGGYSGGGVIAFEMTRRLQAEGERVPLLVMFDTVSPLLANQGAAQTRPWNLEYLLKAPARQVAQWLKPLLGIEDPTKDGPVKRALIRSYLERDEMIPEELRDLHLYDAYMEAQKRYRPMPVRANLLLFRAAKQQTEFLGERLLGWDRLITGPIEAHRIKTDHFEMMSRGAIQHISPILRERLRTAIAPQPEDLAVAKPPLLLTLADWMIRLKPGVRARAAD